MRKSKSWAKLLFSACFLLLISACVDDWGQSDPPAGVQTYVSTANLATYDFEDGVVPETFQLSAQAEIPESMPELVPLAKEDDPDGYYGTVLHVNKGNVRVQNPFNGSLGMTGAVMSFYVKQVPTYKYSYEDDGETVKDSTLVKDLTSDLFCFKSEDGTQSVSITPNGALIYSGAAGEYSVNVVGGSRPTGILESVGDWHWVALQIDKEGYTIYSDGYKRIHEVSTTFNYENIVDFITSTPYLYIGGDNDLYIDNITLRTNELTAEMAKDPRVKEVSGEAAIDPYLYVGPEDCSAPWWSEFSEDTWEIIGDGTFHIGFTNHNSGNGNNWENWLMVVTNGPNSHGDGGSEYFVLRADAFGWGNSDYDGGNISHNFNWDNFVSEMNGAYVDLTVTREGATVSMNANITAKSGTKYNYSYKQGNISSEKIGIFFLVEKAHMVIDSKEIWIGKTYAPGSYLVGPADCSAGWWSEFSEYYTYENNFDVTFKFINNNTGGGANWNNWLLAAATTERGGAGYAEYFVLRSDAYGWGDGSYDGSTIQHGFNWDTYVSDMHSATCWVRVKREGGKLTMTNYTQTAAGKWLAPYSFEYGNITTPSVTLWFLVEQASLDMQAVGTFPAWDNMPGYWQ